mmetsp:Transcript_50189/g.122472  ORF Transcript_50189/g.122472 Transcript_50189/m.122472 type:complete len:377 (-) Transcript_50189:344-1474(-)
MLGGLARSAGRALAPRAVGARSMSLQSKVATYTKRGSPITLALEDKPLAAPAAAEVQVKFLAASVSYSDFKPIVNSYPGSKDIATKEAKVRFAKAQSIGPIDPVAGPLGKPPGLPAVGGLEGVAVVEAVGSSVSGLTVGDWVLPSASVGSWRTHAVVPQGELVKVRSDIPVEYAACLSISPSTALRLLEDTASLKAGDMVIHNGANGMVGQVLVQLCAARGIKVVSVMRHKESFEDMSDYLKSIGSTVVVPEDQLRSFYMKEVFADLPAPKVAFDCVGGESGSLLGRVMPKGGKLVSFGCASGEPMLLPAEKQISVEGFFLSDKKEGRQKTIDTLANMVAEGKLKLLLQRAKYDNFAHSLNKAFEGMRDRRLVMLM